MGAFREGIGEMNSIFLFVAIMTYGGDNVDGYGFFFYFKDKPVFFIYLS